MDTKCTQKSERVCQAHVAEPNDCLVHRECSGQPLWQPQTSERFFMCTQAHAWASKHPCQPGPDTQMCEHKQEAVACTQHSTESTSLTLACSLRCATLCLHTCKHTHARMRTHTRMRTRTAHTTRTHTHAHIHARSTDTRTNTHTRVRACTHTCTHTQVQPRISRQNPRQHLLAYAQQQLALQERRVQVSWGASTLSEL